jgi:hypothetical protein
MEGGDRSEEEEEEEEEEEVQRTQQTQQTREMGDKPWQLAPYKALSPLVTSPDN